MITQIVVTRDDVEKVFWVETDHRNGERMKVEDAVILAEEGIDTYWNVKQVLGEYADSLVLPPKARVGTILHHI